MSVCRPSILLKVSEHGYFFGIMTNIERRGTGHFIAWGNLDRERGQQGSKAGRSLC